MLRMDAQSEIDRIVTALRATITHTFRRRGAIVGVSGGIDSAVTLALAVRAMGAAKVSAFFLPDRDSSPDSEPLARLVTRHYGVQCNTEDVTAALSALGCYSRRDEAVRQVFPDYDPDSDRIKMVLPGNLMEQGRLNISSLVMERPGCSPRQKKPSPSAYRGIVAASNMKQRIRMLTLYYHAERAFYAVVGTANKNEHDLGFFVKYGDGGSDVQPIQHLYKTQVFEIARHLDVPNAIVERAPTTDTYSASCTQQEFYFRLPFELLDPLLEGFEHDVSPSALATRIGLDESQVNRVYRDITQKRQTTEYLRTPPLDFARPPTLVG